MWSKGVPLLHDSESVTYRCNDKRNDMWTANLVSLIFPIRFSLRFCVFVQAKDVTKFSRKFLFFSQEK